MCHVDLLLLKSFESQCTRYILRFKFPFSKYSMISIKIQSLLMSSFVSRDEL